MYLVCSYDFSFILCEGARHLASSSAVVVLTTKIGASGVSPSVSSAITVPATPALAVCFDPPALGIAVAKGILAIKFCNFCSTKIFSAISSCFVLAHSLLSAAKHAFNFSNCSLNPKIHALATMTMDDLSVFNSSSGFSCKHLDKSSNRSFKASLLAFSLTDFFTFFAGLSFVTVVAAVVVSALVVAAATSEGNACFPNVVFVVVVWTEGGSNTKIFGFVFGMVSTGCGNISAKSKEDNAPLSSPSIGKSFREPIVVFDDVARKLLVGRNFAHFVIPLRVQF